MVDDTLKLVRILLPSVIVEDALFLGARHIHLPAPVGADYRFTLWFLGDDTKEISARLLRRPEPDYFWYMPFHEGAYGSLQQLNRHFIEVVQHIMRHRTQIKQWRGKLFNCFECAREATNGWEKVYRVSCLRWIEAPSLPREPQLYLSPPIVAWTGHLQCGDKPSLVDSEA